MHLDPYSYHHWTVTKVKIDTACVDVLANFRKNNEATSGLVPLTSSHYE
jgi:hypothetical protein